MIFTVKIRDQTGGEYYFRVLKGKESVASLILNSVGADGIGEIKIYCQAFSDCREVVADMLKIVGSGQHDPKSWAERIAVLNFVKGVDIG